jgi:glycosyltransferase involved in cell wall biosynthesis
MSDAPDLMVSCLMVTIAQPERWPYLRRSVADYCRQTHSNRELVIVLDSGQPETKAAIAEHIAALRRGDIRIIDAGDKRPLGALRNIARDSAGGDICCQWDDDDLNHPERVERQLRSLLETECEAAFLQETMQFFPQSRTLHCINWRAAPGGGLPGTLMCRRGAPIRYPENGAESEHGEDSAILEQFLTRDSCRFLTGAPYLYVYVSHGLNTSSVAHHRMLARRLGISRALLRRREAEIREGLRPFDFGPEDITVEGYNGTAFTLFKTTGSR